MNRKLTLILAAFIVAIGAAAQDAYKPNAFIVGSDTLRYRELVPEKADRGKFPMLIFLHGSGERGTDNQAQLTHGAQMFLSPHNINKYKAYIVFPQCPEDAFWAYDEIPQSLAAEDMPVIEEPTKWIKMIRGLVSKYINEGKVDANQVYIVGLSMGAMAVYDLAIRYPSMWAAAVAICGTVNPDRLEPARDIKFRIYHGDADPIVPVEASRAIYNRLRKLNASVEYFEYPGCTHGSWNLAFREKDFLRWIFNQSKDPKK